MTNKSLIAGLIQHSNQGDRGRNLEYIKQQATQLTNNGAQLIVLQELHNDAYFCQQEDLRYFDFAESLKGPTFQSLSPLAQKLEAVIVASIFEKRAEGVYHNTAIVIDKDGSLAGFYRKMHIPDDPGFYEKFYFTPGDHTHPAFSPITTSIGRLGVLICWDQWYPEAARLMALAGAEILIYPTAIGWDPNDDQAEQIRQLNAWRSVQVGHAVANHLPVISCNRVGFEADPNNQEHGIQFWGNSFICGPQGETLLQANDKQPFSDTCKLPMNNTENLRKTWPFFRDRRIEAYNDLCQRYIDN